MERVKRNAITWGLAVGLGSRIFALVYAVMRFIVDPSMFDAATTSGAGVLAGTASLLWGPAWALCIGGMVLAVPGEFAVYGYFAAGRTEVPARIGFMLYMICNIFWMPLVGFLALTGVAAASFPQAAPVLVATVFKGAGGLVISFAALTQILGSACTGVAMWRTTTLPKWMGVARLLGGILFALEIFHGGTIVAAIFGCAVLTRLLWAARRGDFPQISADAATVAGRA